MMKRIVVPFDFSVPAVAAWRVALEMAAHSEGRIYVLHIIELPVLKSSVIAPVLDYEQSLMHDLQLQATQRFEKVMLQYPRGSIPVSFRVCFGPVIKTIDDYVTLERIDAVIVGSHGTHGLREMFPGSNAERIVRHSRVPVLITRDYFTEPVRNILFPNTFETDGQEMLVKEIKKLQNFFGAWLHLVWINTPITFTPDVDTKKRMEAFAKHFQLKNFTIGIYNHSDEEKGIIEYAGIVNANLIAMGTHSRRGISHLLTGSLTEDLVNHYNGLIWTYSLKNEPLAV